MAPRGSASQNRKERDASPAGDEDNSTNTNYQKELDDLDIQNPKKTCRHLFLQVLMNRRTMTFDMAKEVYAKCVELCKVNEPETIENFVASLEPGLTLCGLDIKTTRDQETGQVMYVLVNTIQDEPAKQATEYGAHDIVFFKAIMDKIITAPNLSYSILQLDAARLAKPPITKSQAIQLIKSFIAKGWLSLHDRTNRLLLSPRSLIELSAKPRETYNDHDDDDPHYRAVVDCSYCLNIVTSGYVCPNEDCGIRLHTYCVARQIEDGRCPDRLNKENAHPCEQIWPRDPQTRKYIGKPVGVAALGLGDEDEDEDEDLTQNLATSEMDVDMEAPATGKKGKGKGKKGTTSANGKGKGRKKRAQESEEEDEDELMEDDEDEDSNASGSPSGTRKSTLSAGKKRVLPPPDSDEDEE
ncbi:hypothetical protein JCM11641_001342 [Rhodosporidiobolus odoratus]